MLRTIAGVRKALGGKLIGNLTLRKIVCETFPKDAWALTFKGSELKERHLIFLSDELFDQEINQVKYTILHEVGHVIRNHKNSIGITQTQSEIRQQEIEADLFAKQYLNLSK